MQDAQSLHRGDFARVALSSVSDDPLSLVLPSGVVIRGITADNLGLIRALLSQL